MMSGTRFAVFGEIAAPAGEYDLLLGNPEAERPQYELTQVRDVVLAVEGSVARAGDLTANTAYRPGARLQTKKGALQVILWLAVAALVVFLTILTLRLARKEGSE